MAYRRARISATPQLSGLCLMVGLLLIAATASAAPPGAPGPVPPSQIVPDRYIVVLHDTVPSAAAVAVDLERRLGIGVSHVYEHALRGFAANVPPGRLLALQRDPRVAYIEADQTVYAFAQTIPTGVRRIFADENVKLWINGSDDYRVDVDVAVIDTGIADHPDLLIVGRTDCSGGSPFKQSCSDGGTDGNGHGTHVAGTIAALDNGVGVVGVAPGARLWSVKVLADNGSGYMSWIIAGVDWVTARHATIGVANMSLGCECSSSALDSAIGKSVAKGVVYVVAAGNSAKNVSTFSPANHPDVIAVSALADFDGLEGGLKSPTCRQDEDDTLANFSNFGSGIHVAAPGVCIYSTWLNNGYHTISGTSMASPHAAGAAAILVSKNKPKEKKDVLAIRKILRDTGNFNWNDDSGDGIKEPLLDLRSTTVFNPKLTPDDGGTTTDNPPTVLITSPEDGADVSGNVTVAANATDDKGVTQVEFFANGDSIAVVTMAPWQTTWNSTSSADGSHTLTATATDTAMQTTSHSISVAVKNGGGETSSAATNMGVFSITSAVTSNNKHLDVTVNIRRDSNPDNMLTDVDGFVSGASVTFNLKNGNNTWIFSGSTDSVGNFRGRLVNAPNGSYTAEVTTLNASGLTWLKTLDNGNPSTFAK